MVLSVSEIDCEFPTTTVDLTYRCRRHSIADPDMLEVGNFNEANSTLGLIESRSHFGGWCIVCLRGHFSLLLLPANGCIPFHALCLCEHFLLKHLYTVFYK